MRNYDDDDDEASKLNVCISLCTIIVVRGSNFQFDRLNYSKFSYCDVTG